MFKWIRTYPMTVLMIIACLIGGPYFGGKMAYEKIEAYQDQVVYTDVLSGFAGTARTVKAFAKADEQNTSEDLQAAIEAGEFRLSFTKVKKSYLNDAVFIGDSRTDTLRLYSGWTNTTYYCKTGTNIWNIMDDEVAEDKETGKQISIDKALQKYKYGKVYLMVGVNELGTGTAETFYQQYKKVVERIRELQPDAIIFIQSIMHVTSAKDAEGTSINNTNINERNSWLQKLDNGQDIFYIDENEVLDDKNGALDADSTFDGVHLTADSVGPWKKFILSHAIEKKD